MLFLTILVQELRSFALFLKIFGPKTRNLVMIFNYFGQKIQNFVLFLKFFAQEIQILLLGMDLVSFLTRNTKLFVIFWEFQDEKYDNWHRSRKYFDDDYKK